MDRVAYSRLAVATLVAVVVGAFVVPSVIARLAGQRLRAAASARGLEVRWSRARGEWPALARFERVVIGSERLSDTLLDARELEVVVSPFSLAGPSPRLAWIRLQGATVRPPSRNSSDPDTLVPEENSRDPRDDPRKAERIRRAADELVRLLLTPARQLPELRLDDVTLIAPSGAQAVWGGIRFTSLRLGHPHGSARLRMSGSLLGEHPVSFTGELRYSRNDRIEGEVEVGVPDAGGRASRLRLAVDGAVSQDRARGRLVVHDSTRVTVGSIPFQVGAVLDRAGPRVRFQITSSGLTEGAIDASLPPAVLGELVDLGVRGSWDYRLAFDLDFARPDSVTFESEVEPHGLALEPARTRLPILNLDRPFVATIHLPRDRVVRRELSPANPNFSPLGAISPQAALAVVTNEDGAFFRHHGFNPDAVKEAIAENLRAGAFRRGAGTITMQLARNLYLGHERSLSRKFREVVLAWVLEHLTGISKHRLLEIYLNIIEWGPGLQGIGEASRYYFDRDPADLSVAEGLFLATIVPAPSKWRNRFNAYGELRPFARAQMHFIGRAMVRKGWLDPYELPDPDWLQIELRGPARERFVPRPSPLDTLEA